MIQNTNSLLFSFKMSHHGLSISNYYISSFGGAQCQTMGTIKQNVKKKKQEGGTKQNPVLWKI